MQFARRLGWRLSYFVPGAGGTDEDLEVLGLFPVWCKDEPLRSRCRMGFAQVSRTGFSVFDSCECLKEAAWSVTWDSVHSCATAGKYFCLRVKERNNNGSRRVKALMFRLRREKAVDSLMDNVEARLGDYIATKDARARPRRGRAGTDAAGLPLMPTAVAPQLEGAPAEGEGGEDDFGLETHAVLQRYQWNSQVPISTSSALRAPPITALVEGTPTHATPPHMRTSSRRKRLESYVSRVVGKEPQTRRELLVQEG